MLVAKITKKKDGKKKEKVFAMTVTMHACRSWDAMGIDTKQKWTSEIAKMRRLMSWCAAITQCLLQTQQPIISLKITPKNEDSVSHKISLLHIFCNFSLSSSPTSCNPSQAIRVQINKKLRKEIPTWYNITRFWHEISPIDLI